MTTRLTCALAALLAACIPAQPGGFEEYEEQGDWQPTGGKADSMVGPIVVTEIGDGFVEVRNDGDAAVDLTGYLVSFSYRRVRLEPRAGHPTVVAPGALALILDHDEAIPPRVPPGTAIVATSRDIRELLAYSKRLIVRTPDKLVTDRADGRAPAAPGVSVERRLKTRWELSAFGATPGVRNTLHDDRAIRPLFDPLEDDLVAFIDGAEHTLDAALYQLEEPRVVAALVAAADRGVAVRLATDSEYLEDPAYADAYGALVDGGAAVIGDGRSARMHHKFLVADGRRVWTGSYNPVGGSHYRVVDNAVIVESRALAAAHTAEVDELMSGAFGPHKADGAGHEAYVDGARVELYFAPTDDTRAAILRAIETADSNIYFSQFAFYDGEIAAAMRAKAAAGVDVRGVFDRRSASSVSQYGDFVDAGLDVRRPFYDVMLHHKVVIIDYGTTDPIVITGSYNLSNTAATANDESVVMIHDPYVARAYYEAWRRSYDDASGPNTDTTGLAPLAIAEVMAGDGGFVELANLDDRVVDLDGLALCDRDGNAVPLRGAVGAGGRAIVPADGLGLGHDDALMVMDRSRRVVTTFDHPAYPGRERSLERGDLVAPDLDAPWAPSMSPGGTPGW